MFAVSSVSHNAQLFPIITVAVILAMNLEKPTAQRHAVPIVFRTRKEQSKRIAFVFGLNGFSCCRNAQ